MYLIIFFIISFRRFQFFVINIGQHKYSQPNSFKMNLYQISTLSNIQRGFLILVKKSEQKDKERYLLSTIFFLPDYIYYIFQQSKHQQFLLKIIQFPLHLFSICLSLCHQYLTIISPTTKQQFQKLKTIKNSEAQYFIQQQFIYLFINFILNLFGFQMFDLEILPISQIIHNDGQFGSSKYILGNSYKSPSNKSLKDYSPNNRFKFKKKMQLANITNFNQSATSPIHIKIEDDASDLKMKCTNQLSPKKKPHIDNETILNMSRQQQYSSTTNEEKNLTRKSKLMNKNKLQTEEQDFENTIAYKENTCLKKNNSCYRDQKQQSYHPPYYNTSIVFSKSITQETHKNNIFSEYKAEKVIADMKSPLFSPRYQEIMDPPLNLQLKQCSKPQTEITECKKSERWDCKRELEEIYNGKFKICKLQQGI